MEASRMNNKDMINLLMAYDADPNRVNSVSWGLYNNYWDINFLPQPHAE